MWHMHDTGWGWWVLMSIGMVAFWGLVLYVALSWVRRDDRAGQPPESGDPPLVVLKRRLAAGEISLEEYEQLRSALAEDPPVHAPA